MGQDSGVRKSKVHSIFVLDEELKNRLKVQAAKENKDMSIIVEELLEKYLKEHGDGNPSYQLTQWQEQSDFRVTPAFARTNKDWMLYLQKCDAKELQYIAYHGGEISGMARRYLEALQRGQDITHLFLTL